jgi:hypothetical protein
MTRRLVLLLTALALLALPVSFAGAASAGAPPPSPDYSPRFGPPGTVVTVSGITLCDGQVAETGQIGLAMNQASVHTPALFTPPTATITIPDAANGDYFIYLLCGAAVEGLPFTVTGSTVAPQPIGAAPIFTG